MIGKIFASLTGAALMLSMPAAAQEDPADQRMAQVLAALETAFEAEPLTPEQEARLPAAQLAVGKLVPEGTMARMMRQVMGDMLDPMVSTLMAGGMEPGNIAEATGVPLEDLVTLDDASRAEITAILDPAFEQRGRLMIDHMTAAMGDMYAAMEPLMREGLTRAYAARFTDRQLADINAFFATPSGEVFARESLLVYSDPQAMSAVMKGMPMMMQAMPDMLAGMEAAQESLPPVRNYDGLEDAERARLAELLDISSEELQANMGWAAENSDEDSGTGWEE